MIGLGKAAKNIERGDAWEEIDEVVLKTFGQV